MADKHTQAAKQSSSKHSHQASFQPPWGPAHRRIPWKQELSTHRETHSEHLVKRLACPHKRAVVGRGAVDRLVLCCCLAGQGRGEVNARICPRLYVCTELWGWSPQQQGKRTLFSSGDCCCLLFPSFCTGHRNFPLAQHKHMLTSTFSSCPVHAISAVTPTLANTVLFVEFDLHFML